ncbi:hypothetical protein [Luteolibacter sp. LG18]|uniref:hypothetical protein n=1 Tax=Luteolibacter sp. LG18 TaxID=2819286 RepID=UPI002B27CCF3|nr:hypothetical protein llg_13430 [Luteolibacter sp. LG18]
MSAALACAAGPFAAPAEGPVPFRRDRVPLDVGTMTGLSRELTLLVPALGTEEPADRRRIAQALALALALDPANREARELLATVGAGRELDPLDDSKAEDARAGLWKLLEWLGSTEAGQDGQALAACLLDVAAAVDPFHENARDHKQDGGAWNGWIPALASYQPKEVTPVEPLIPDTPKTTAPVFARTQATVTTPLWMLEKDALNGGDHYVMRPRVINMRAAISQRENGDDANGFRFILQNTQNHRAQDRTSDTVTKALKAMGDTFPTGGRANLDCSGDYLVDANRKSISAAAAVLMDAAVSGREPHATVMGVIGEDGSFKLPTRAWDRLRALSNGPGGRLVLPREAEPMMSAILVMEDPAFFMKYEVILAGSLKELVERSAKESQGTLADVSARFAEVRSKQGTMAVGQYAANRFVRQRLTDIAQAYPDHASARMLDLQGAGKRPTWLPRPYLASEIRRAMEPIGGMVTNQGFQNIDVDTIEKVLEASRPALESLERYVDMRDRDLTAHGKDVLTAVRNLIKARRTRDEDNGYQRFQTARDAVKGAYESFKRELDAVTAEEEALPGSENR